MKNNYSLLIKVFLGCVSFILMMLMFNYFTISHNTYTIGTKNFTEQRIIAYIIEDLIEDKTDYEIDVITGLGETSFLHNAIIHNDIDMYVEYSSNAYEGILKYKYSGESNEEIKEIVMNDYENKYDLYWPVWFGFENTNAIICTDYCINNKIDSLDDIQNEDEFLFAAPPYFYERSDGYNLLTENYQINLQEKNTINMDPILIYQSLIAKEIDMGLGFTTDGRLFLDNFIVLNDSMNVFPKYDAGLVVNNKVVMNEEIMESLTLLNNTISEEDMKSMNYAVEVSGEDEETVANDFYLQNIK